MPDPADIAELDQTSAAIREHIEKGVAIAQQYLSQGMDPRDAEVAIFGGIQDADASANVDYLISMISVFIVQAAQDRMK